MQSDWHIKSLLERDSWRIERFEELSDRQMMIAQMFMTALAMFIYQLSVLISQSSIDNLPKASHNFYSRYFRFSLSIVAKKGRLKTACFSIYVRQDLGVCERTCFLGKQPEAEFPERRHYCSGQRCCAVRFHHNVHVTITYDIYDRCHCRAVCCRTASRRIRVLVGYICGNKYISALLYTQIRAIARNYSFANLDKSIH